MLMLSSLVAVGMILISGYSIVCKNFKKAEYNKGQKKDVIIVLGYGAKADGKMSPILRERVYKAETLYKEGVAKKIICTGGAVANRHIEAEVMAQVLVARDVPKEHIIQEKCAKNTYGNFMLSKKIMEEEGLKTAVIVSSPWHVRKASAYARKLELNHTVEKSKYPREYLMILGGSVIYLYEYTRMLISLVKKGDSK